MNFHHQYRADVFSVKQNLTFPPQRFAALSGFTIELNYHQNVYIFIACKILNSIKESRQLFAAPAFLNAAIPHAILLLPILGIRDFGISHQFIRALDLGSCGGGGGGTLNPMKLKNVNPIYPANTSRSSFQLRFSPPNNARLLSRCRAVFVVVLYTDCGKRAMCHTHILLQIDARSALPHVCGECEEACVCVLLPAIYFGINRKSSSFIPFFTHPDNT